MFGCWQLLSLTLPFSPSALLLGKRIRKCKCFFLWHLWEGQTLCWNPHPGCISETTKKLQIFNVQRCSQVRCSSTWISWFSSLFLELVGSHLSQKASWPSDSKLFHIFLMCVWHYVSTFKPTLWWESTPGLWGIHTKNLSEL